MITGQLRCRSSAGARWGAGALLLTVLVTCGCHQLLIRPTFKGHERVLESDRLQIRTDLSPETLVAMLRAAEETLDQLHRFIPAPPAAATAKRPIIAFANTDSLQAYLAAHLFTEKRAIGFYCDLGGECALVWNDPPRPEDIRVLRHELAHQHLDLCLAGSVPGWLEEGLAEQLALGGLDRGLGPPAAEAAAPSPPTKRGRPVRPSLYAATGWPVYRRQRASLDSVFAALALHPARRSWPDRESRPADVIPPPSWADGSEGYVLHLLFVLYLEDCGEGLEGALGRLLQAARDGNAAELDLSRRFATLKDLDEGFHDYVYRRGLRAMALHGASLDPRLRSAAHATLLEAGRPAVSPLQGAPRRPGANPAKEHYPTARTGHALRTQQKGARRRR
ncbi:hypothetical protein ACFL59_06990 [Planctomycetota bacterium]